MEFGCKWICWQLALTSCINQWKKCLFSHLIRVEATYNSSSNCEMYHSNKSGKEIFAISISHHAKVTQCGHCQWTTLFDRFRPNVAILRYLICGFPPILSDRNIATLHKMCKIRDKLKNQMLQKCILNSKQFFMLCTQLSWFSKSQPD